MTLPAARLRNRPAILLALAVIVLAGAGLRGWQAAHPRLAHESVDERVYAALARTLAEDVHYGDRTTGPRHPFIAAPGAPFAFAAARRLTPSPPGAPTDIPAAYWLLAVVGTLLVAATFALGRRLGGDAAGLVAAAVVAVYPPLVRTTGELLERAVRRAAARAGGPGPPRRSKLGAAGPVRDRRCAPRRRGDGTRRSPGRPGRLSARAARDRRREGTRGYRRRRGRDRARGRSAGARPMGRVRVRADELVRTRRRDRWPDAARRRLPAGRRQPRPASSARSPPRPARACPSSGAGATRRCPAPR